MIRHHASRLALLAAALALAASGCGGSDPGGSTADGTSILAGNEVLYLEGEEATNGSEANSEVTGYALDLDGLRIEGVFEASGTTSDFYRFDTGPFTRVDVQVFVDGVKQTEQNYEVSLTLNSYVNDGYSTLSGHGYFINAWLSGTNKAYVLGISGPAGKSYVIEMKGR